MDNIHKLSSGEFHIFSDVEGHPIDLCRTQPALHQPVIVGSGTLRYQRFRFKAVAKNIYEIWADDRHIRSVDDHIYGSLDRMDPQRWVITPSRGNSEYTIETLDCRAWSDPGGAPGCEHKLYLHSVWQPIGPQQTFTIQPA